MVLSLVFAGGAAGGVRPLTEPTRPAGHGLGRGGEKTQYSEASLGNGSVTRNGLFAQSAGTTGWWRSTPPPAQPPSARRHRGRRHSDSGWAAVAAVPRVAYLGQLKAGMACAERAHAQPEKIPTFTTKGFGSSAHTNRGRLPPDEVCRSPCRGHGLPSNMMLLDCCCCCSGIICRADCTKSRRPCLFLYPPSPLPPLVSALERPFHGEPRRGRRCVPPKNASPCPHFPAPWV